METLIFRKTLDRKHQILVFRSNIDNPRKRAIACGELVKIEGVHHVNVDLDDWENVLRVECHPQIRAGQIEQQMAQLGFECSEL